MGCGNIEPIFYISDILTYFYRSCPAPIYLVYSLITYVSFYWTFTRFIEKISCMNGCLHTTGYQYLPLVRWANLT